MNVPFRALSLPHVTTLRIVHAVALTSCGISCSRLILAKKWLWLHRLDGVLQPKPNKQRTSKQNDQKRVICFLRINLTSSSFWVARTRYTIWLVFYQQIPNLFSTNRRREMVVFTEWNWFNVYTTIREALLVRTEEPLSYHFLASCVSPC